MHVLSGDIGGTSTRLTLYRWSGESRKVVTEARYGSGEFDGIEDVLGDFLQSVTAPIEAAGFGVAGPVRGGKVKTTNLPWAIDAAKLAQTLRLPAVSLINDLEAFALGVDFVKDQWRTLQPSTSSSSSRLFVGAGTGLGVAYELAGEVASSEGGHITFAPEDDDEVRLWGRARKLFGRVSAERIVSGSALPLLYSHYADTLASTPDVAADVEVRGGAAVSAAAGAGDAAAKAALAKFVSLFGRVCGDLALVLRPRDVLLGGGLTLEFAGAMENFTSLFMDAFNAKGRMRALNEGVGVHVVAAESAARLGAASDAIRLARSGST